MPQDKTPQPTLEELTAGISNQQRLAQEAKKALSAALLPKLEELKAIYASAEFQTVYDRLTAAVPALEGGNSYSATQASNLLRLFDQVRAQIDAEVNNHRNTSTMIIT